ncbi:hypothetical protein FSBG_00346 [Fusobacterium gonidiaformans 3-1-5R]|uniref:Uncharacterized protein n=2 Tax=Fusobacterium TaxID=848 RepID=E5BFG8_9FUSO|nr:MULTISPECIES: hypothetical protein [Fusobacterium]EFS20849.1 hypothetical protein FSBG_00346 [Fusobacterium gonidiaformans 3-1-5R]KXA12303.1 hypothetical protein HMPREF3206_01790 [Fusobacterium equinum]
MKWIFRKDKFIEHTGSQHFEKALWVDEADGKEVIFKDENFGLVKGVGVTIVGVFHEYAVLREWCEVVQ